MTASVEQLVTIPTKDEVLQTLIDGLDGLGFQASSWQSGSEQRTLVEVFAQTYVTLATNQVDIAKSGFSVDAVGGWLTILSKSLYDNDRQGAQTTQGTVVLTADATAPGPFTIDTTTNQKIFADSVNGYLYRNITGGTLNAGGTLEVTVQADVAASNRDVANNTITNMVTPLPGVTANNPAIVGSTTWIMRYGADDESDIELHTRNVTKWPTLSPDSPEAAYRNWATTADTTVTRASLKDNNPRGPGTTDLILAGANGAVGASVITAVDNYIQGVTDGKRRRGLNVDLLVKSATNLIVNISGTIYILSQYHTPELEDTIEDKIDEFFKAIPIGGTKTSTSVPGKVIFGNLVKTIVTAGTGIVSVNLGDPTGDVDLLESQVAIPNISFIYESVTPG